MITEQDWAQLESDWHAQRDHCPPRLPAVAARHLHCGPPSGRRTDAHRLGQHHSSSRGTAPTCTSYRAPAAWRCSSPGSTRAAANYASCSPTPSLREVFNPLASDIAATAHVRAGRCRGRARRGRTGSSTGARCCKASPTSGLTPEGTARPVRRALLPPRLSAPSDPARRRGRPRHGPGRPARTRTSSSPRTAIEVKTSSGKEPQTIVISSERELDDTGDRPAHPRALLAGRAARRQRREPERHHRPHPRPVGDPAAARSCSDGLLVRVGYLSGQRGPVRRAPLHGAQAAVLARDRRLSADHRG